MPQKPAAKVDWHRLFGLLLMDYFTGSPYQVETELDLSLHQQFLDVVVVRKTKGRLKEPLPDGLEGLTAHNLITFKSHHEPLEDFALKELTGHYVNYLKQQSGRGEPLLPEAQFRLYAVCCRLEHGFAQSANLHALREGVYDCVRGTDRIRVVVTSQLPQTENNAPLHLFSASGEKVEFGATHYHQRSEKTSSLLQQLFAGYLVEGVKMPYNLDDFYRDWLKNHAGEVFDWLKNHPGEVFDWLKNHPGEVLERLTPEQRVKGLSADELERLLQKQRAAEAAEQNKSGKPGRGSPKRGSK